MSVIHRSRRDVVKFNGYGENLYSTTKYPYFGCTFEIHSRANLEKKRREDYPYERSKPLLHGIQIMEARRFEQEMVISFDDSGWRNTKEYEAIAVSTSGEITKQKFPKSESSMNKITFRALKEHIHYTFKIRSIGTKSKPDHVWESELIYGIASHGILDYWQPNSIGMQDCALSRSKNKWNIDDPQITHKYVMDLWLQDISNGPISWQMNQTFSDAIYSSSRNNIGYDKEKESIIKDVDMEISWKTMSSLKKGKFAFEGTLLSLSFCKPERPLPSKKFAIKRFGLSEYHNKILYAGDDERKKRTEKEMWREAWHLSQLDHPNVVRYVHSGKCQENLVYIVMELCHADTLKDRIENPKKYPKFGNLEFCKTALLHITKGLHYIHSKKILHRDLKPSNILFSIEGNTAKISDFGLSKRIDPEITTTESIGTLGYCAPEIFEYEAKKSEIELVTSSQFIDERTDIFSLGLIFFFVLSHGKHPFGQSHEQNRCCTSVSQCKWVTNIAKGKSHTDGLEGPGAALAKDSINNMLQYKKENRPTAAQVLEHPYFWRNGQIADFFSKVISFLEPAWKTREKKYDQTKQQQRKTFTSYIQYPMKEKFSNEIKKLKLDQMKVKKLYEIFEETFIEFEKNKVVKNMDKQAPTTSERKLETMDDQPISLECSIHESEERTEKDSTRTNDEAPQKELTSDMLDRHQLLSAINGLRFFRWRPDRAVAWKIMKEILESENYITDEEYVKKKFRKSFKVYSIRWKKCLLNAVAVQAKTNKSEDQEKFAKDASGASPEIIDLIKFIRNRLTHLEKIKKESSTTWPSDRDDILNFFDDVVPELLPHMYNVMKMPLKDYIEENRQKDYNL